MPQQYSAFVNNGWSYRFNTILQSVSPLQDFFHTSMKFTPRYCKCGRWYPLQLRLWNLTKIKIQDPEYDSDTRKRKMFCLWCTVYPKKYARFCCAVLCCSYTLTDFPYPSGLLHWHCGNRPIAPVPAKQPWWIWINTSYEFIMNDCITTKKTKHNKTVCIFLGIYCINKPIARVLMAFASSTPIH